MKMILTNHKEIDIRQREDLGCIATGYEWMIRFAKIENVDLTDFQEKFNLQERGLANNSFRSIGDAIQKNYPQIKIGIESFVDGQEKIEFIKNLIVKQNPCLISVPNGYGGYHIMPVLGFDDSKQVFYFYNPAAVNTNKEALYKTIMEMHANNGGGHDISWIPPNKI